MARYVPLGRAATRTVGSVSGTGTSSGGAAGGQPSGWGPPAPSTAESARTAPGSAKPYEERSTLPVSSRKRRGSGGATPAAPRSDSTPPPRAAGSQPRGGEATRP